MKITVKEVSTPAEFTTFCQFQNRLYADCPWYVPTLDSEQEEILSKSKCLEYCSRKLLLAYDENGRVAGRCCALVNLRYNIFYNARRMRFAWTDFIESYDVFKALMDAAIEWGRSLGMTEIHGPLEYNTMYRQGMVVGGFDSVPRAGDPYNFSYYPKFVEKYGFRKEADMVQYQLNGHIDIPQSYEGEGRDLLAKHDLHIVSAWRMLRQHKAISKFCEQYNASMMGHVQNFIPLTDSELETAVTNLSGKVRNDLSCFIMDKDNELAAFAICSPDISEVMKNLNGSLEHRGKYQLWKGNRKFEDVDFIIEGCSPKFREVDLSPIYISNLARKFKKKGIRYCITAPQMEGSAEAKAWERHPDKQLYIRRRSYIMSI